MPAPKPKPRTHADDWSDAALKVEKDTRGAFNLLTRGLSWLAGVGEEDEEEKKVTRKKSAGPPLRAKAIPKALPPKRVHVEIVRQLPPGEEGRK